jgi:hypothetical protein
MMRLGQTIPKFQQQSHWFFLSQAAARAHGGNARRNCAPLLFRSDGDKRRKCRAIEKKFLPKKTRLFVLLFQAFTQQKKCLRRR